MSEMCPKANYESGRRRTREAKDAGKLKALRAAARAGVGALDRGDFKEFGNIEELQTYLHDLSERVISRTTEWCRHGGAEMARSARRCC
jgi:hypothetical protein